MYPPLLAQIEKRPDSLWHALIDSLLQQNFNQKHDDHQADVYEWSDN